MVMLQGEMDSELDLKQQCKRTAKKSRGIFDLCIQRDHIMELGARNTYIYGPDVDIPLGFWGHHYAKNIGKWAKIQKTKVTGGSESGRIYF